MEMEMDILDTLGEGSFGTVYRVRVPGEQEELACKLFEGEQESFLDDIQQEIDIMSILRAKATPSTPIVRMHHFHIARSPHDPCPSFITMDLCRGGSLLDLLASCPRLSEQDAALVIATIAKALVFCHMQARILHLDVKPANILFVKKDCLDSARLADFGLSVQLQGHEDIIYNEPGAVGTPAFLAPEAKAYGRYSAAADTWSLGAVLFRMLMGHNPQPRHKGAFDVDLEEEGDTWKSLSPSAHNLMQGMLCRDPELRLTLPQVLCNPWVLLKGNTSMLDRPTTTTISPLSASPRRRALGCPPGFEKVPYMRNNTKQCMAESMICSSDINGLGTPASLIEDKHVASLRQSGLPCPPGFHVPVKLNGCYQSTMINKGAPPTLAADCPRRAPLCPPGFKAPMKTGCSSTYESRDGCFESMCSNIKMGPTLRIA